jgi:hypothetical protein
VLADVPLFKSLPPPAAVARKYVVAHAGDATEISKIAIAKFRILMVLAPKAVERAQRDFYMLTLIRSRFQGLLAD